MVFAASRFSSRFFLISSTFPILLISACLLLTPKSVKIAFNKWLHQKAGSCKVSSSLIFSLKSTLSPTQKVNKPISTNNLAKPPNQSEYFAFSRFQLHLTTYAKILPRGAASSATSCGTPGTEYYFLCPVCIPFACYANGN